jgi:hypothetical protein
VPSRARLDKAGVNVAGVGDQALVDEAHALIERPDQPDFMSFGFVHVGVWGRRPS